MLHLYPLPRDTLLMPPRDSQKLFVILRPRDEPLPISAPQSAKRSLRAPTPRRAHSRPRPPVDVEGVSTEPDDHLLRIGSDFAMAFVYSGTGKATRRVAWLGREEKLRHKVVYH